MAMRLASVLLFIVGFLVSQESLPRDRHWDNSYHPYPDYRESEGHPLRIVSYLLHPVGWVLREGITRPISYFASKTQMSRSVTGFRFDGDFAYNSCFTTASSLNCRELQPFKNLK